MRAKQVIGHQETETALRLASPPETHIEPTSTGLAATALLVEDDDRVRRLLATVLGEGGLSVLAADNGEEALALAAEHPETIQILITDVVMPQMSGRELADRLNATRPETKVLFISGYADDRVLPEELQAGRAFLQKPFAMYDLLHCIEQLLESSG